MSISVNSQNLDQTFGTISKGHIPRCSMSCYTILFELPLDLRILFRSVVYNEISNSLLLIVRIYCHSYCSKTI